MGQTVRFIAFDVETPNRYNNRMSAIGVSVIEAGKIIDDWYSLINPETHFDYFNTRLTGIDEYIVADAPTFPEVWKQIGPMLSSGIVVAHNAVFDLGVLKKCLADYEIDWKNEVPYLCTVQMGRRLLPGMKHNLNCMCDYYGINLDHHKADSDSRACAEILLRYMEGGCKVEEFVKRYYL
jgi:DNA polymerase-3 subunit epsilon